MIVCKALLVIWLFVNLFVFFDGVLSLIKAPWSWFESLMCYMLRNKMYRRGRAILAFCGVGYLLYTVCLGIEQTRLERDVQRRFERLTDLQKESINTEEIAQSFENCIQELKETFSEE